MVYKMTLEVTVLPTHPHQKLNLQQKMNYNNRWVYLKNDLLRVYRVVAMKTTWWILMTRVLKGYLKGWLFDREDLQLKVSEITYFKVCSHSKMYQYREVFFRSLHSLIPQILLPLTNSFKWPTLMIRRLHFKSYFVLWSSSWRTED